MDGNRDKTTPHATAEAERTPGATRTELTQNMMEIKIQVPGLRPRKRWAKRQGPPQVDLSLAGRYPGWAIATCETFPDLFQIQWQRAQAEVPG